ncbi:SWIM zinc finger family protein [Clostridium saccharoperbutylacetonicum]|uniref:SWIM zinc finger family protein n=1 Tax=Clostridium saccharoperbutylacetonicum TaxID=36745 RepID=UPI0039E75513
MKKIKVLCDASYREYLNYASVGCSFEYSNIKYNFSKTLDFERYKDNLDTLGSNFAEMYSIFFTMENLLKLNLLHKNIEIVNDNLGVVNIINKCIRKNKKNRDIYYANVDISIFLRELIDMYLKFDRLVISFLKRDYTKDAHLLCKKEAEPIIKMNRLKCIEVDCLECNVYIARNIKKGTKYLVDIEKPTCTCRYFYYENKSQSCNLKLCKHIVAVKDFIRRAIKDEYVIELSK